MNLEQLKSLSPKEQEALFKRIDLARKKGKATNYSATYGAGGATIARSAGVSEKEGKELHEAYWKLNWSIPAVADTLEVRTFNKQRWLKNPVSGFWYSLRHDKDRWSTLNQGTGVYCFDKWVENARRRKLPICGQFHDEVIAVIKVGQRKRAIKCLKDAVREVNEELKLNRDLDVDVQFGDSYADIH